MPDGCKGSPPDNVKRRQIAAFSMCMDVSSLSPRDYVPFFILRGDRIVIGEVRGQEAVDLLQAMNTGHDGSFCTGHANSCRDMLARLETMVLMGMELPLPAIRSQIASALDVMVHVARMRNRSRKVTAIEEVVGIENGESVLRPLFSLDGEGELRKAGDLRCQEKLRRAGYGL